MLVENMPHTLFKLRLGEESQKQQLRKRLADALESGDVEELRNTIEDAQGVLEAKELYSAQELLKKLQRQVAARRGLVEAIESGDMSRLQKALEEAEDAGLGAADLAKARDMLDAETRKLRARDALKSAVQSEDISRLRAAIDEGEKVKLSEEELAPARQKLATLEKQNVARSKLDEALEQTRRSEGDAKKDSLSALQTAIEGGEAVDLEKKTLDPARLTLETELRKERARMQLQKALASGDIEDLTKAIEEAEAANLGPEIAPAQTALKNARRRAAARKALQEAQKSGDASKIRTALDRAEAAGLSEEELRSARAMLSKEDLKAVARRRLQDAIASRDKDALQAALESATVAGLPSDDADVAKAQQVLKDEVRKERATQALRLTAAGQDAEALRRCLDEARAAAVHPSDIADAEAALKRLEAQEAARKQLQNAMSMTAECKTDVPEAVLKDLEKAIKSGEEADLGGLGTELDKARNMLDQENRRASARRALQKALVSRNESALQEAIQEGEAAGLSAHELAGARAALAAEDEKSKARKRLQQAMAAKAIGPLKSAISVAERAGLRAEELREAKELLKELEEKARIKFGMHIMDCFMTDLYRFHLRLWTTLD